MLQFGDYVQAATDLIRVSWWLILSRYILN
jgi:hypothetical protein